MPAGIPCDSIVEVNNVNGPVVSLPIAPTPIIASTFNAQGPSAGGGQFFIFGTWLDASIAVTIDGTPATVTTSGAGYFLVTAPPHPVGPATVVLTTPSGCIATTSYTYY